MGTLSDLYSMLEEEGRRSLEGHLLDAIQGIFDSCSRIYGPQD